MSIRNDGAFRDLGLLGWWIWENEDLETKIKAWEQGKIKSGDLVVLAAFGSGFTWGSVIIRW